MSESRDIKSNSSNGNSSPKVRADEKTRREEHADVSESILTDLFENVAGARALYAFLASIFSLIITYEELKCYYNEQEREKRYLFWSGQWSSLSDFFVIWIKMHAVIFLIVYPAGKFMRDKSTALCALTSIFSIFLLKFIVYQSSRELTAKGKPLSPTMGVAIGSESTRLFMKIISYLAECTNGEIRSGVTFNNLMYFMFAPTLVYKNEYARSPGPVRWTRGIKYLLEFVFIMYMKGLWFKNFFQPIAEMIEHSHTTSTPLTRDQIMYSVLICSLSSIIIYLVIAFGFLHFYMNSFAEFMRFSDRKFYRSWWKANSPAILMRDWNLVIQEWLHRYIFQGLSGFLGKLFAVLMVFLISGAYHDYVLALAVGFVSPCFTAVMAITALMVIIDPVLQTLNRKFPNFLFTLRNYWGMAQFGCIITFVTFEYQARILCADTRSQSTFDELTTLRFPSCFKFQ